MEICEFYRQLIVKGVKRAIDEEDRIVRIVKNANDPEKTTVRPVVIGGKTLVLPTPALLGLSKEAWETRIAFHPLCESLTRGESEVLQWLKDEIIARLNKNMGFLLINYARAAASKDDMTPELARSFMAIKKMDEKTFDAVTRLIQRYVEKRQFCLTNIYLRRDFAVENVKYRRAAVVTFPLLEDLLDETHDLHGVKLTKQARANIIELLRIIVPSADVENHYNCGSNADIAPYMTALLAAFETLTKVLNRAAENLSKVDPTANDLIIDLSFMDEYASACKRHMTLPSLPGNVGNGGETGTIEKVNRDTVLDPRDSTPQTDQRLQDRFGRRSEPERSRFSGGLSQHHDGGGSRFSGRRFPSQLEREEPVSRFSRPGFGSGLGGGSRFSTGLSGDRASKYASGDVEQTEGRFGALRRSY